MTPSRQSLVVLLGLAASIHALPAPIAEDALAPRQIGLTPPKYSISWDPPLPVPTEDPEAPEESSVPDPPKPSDQISLSPPSFSISWDPPLATATETPDEPDYPPSPPKTGDQISLSPPSFSISWDPPLATATEEPDPEDPEDPEYPPAPKPSDQISLGKPSYSITWDGAAPTPASTSKNHFPWWPKPTKKTTSSKKPTVTASISWNKRQEDEPEPTDVPEPEDPELPEDPEPEDPEPEDPGTIEIPPFPLPNPANSIGLGQPKATIIWGKRQDEEPEPTDVPEPEDPEFPEDPEPEDPGTIEIPPFPLPNPANSIGITPPQATIIWGKRQEDEEPEPTDVPEPEDPEDPEFPEDPEPEDPGFPIPTPGNSIGIQPPQMSFSWGKRQYDPTFGLGKPTASLDLPHPPKPTKSKKPTKTKTKTKAPLPPATTIGGGGWISWGKRQDDEMPITGIPIFPEPSDSVTMEPPQASMSWGKRDADADDAVPPPSIGLGNPFWSIWWPKPPKTSAYISWGKRQDDETPITAIPDPAPTPGDDITLAPPQASISWGKREAEADAQANTIGLGNPQYSIWWPKPPKTSAHISWGKREADAQVNTIGIVFPSNLPVSIPFPLPPVYTPPSYVTWGKREAEAAPEPTAAAELVDAKVPEFTCGLTTTVSRVKPCPKIGCAAPCHYTPEDFEVVDDREPSYGPPLDCPITKTATNNCPTCDCPKTLQTITLKPTWTPTPTGCPTVTKTIVPPCVPPICPDALIACRPTPLPLDARDADKPIPTLSIGKPTPVLSSKAPANTGPCADAATVTRYLPCPTYTCVPHCPAVDIMR